MSDADEDTKKYVVKEYSDYEVGVWLHDPPGSVLIALCSGRYKQDNAEQIARAMNDYPAQQADKIKLLREQIRNTIVDLRAILDKTKEVE